MTGPHFALPIAQTSPLSGDYTELFVILGYSLLVTCAYVMTRRSLQDEIERSAKLSDVLERAAERHPDVKRDAEPYLRERLEHAAHNKER